MPISTKLSQSLMARALKGEPLERPPVWLMRQAGRTDPAYHAYKASLGMHLEEMFENPEVATKVSLLPRRIGVDAIIFYQDILTILGPMGAKFIFRPGPVLTKSIDSLAEIEALRSYDVAEGLPFIASTLTALKAELNDELPVLGFAGAPMTLAAFLIEGQSYGKGTERFKRFLHEEPAAADRLLRKLSDMTVEYLRHQAECGVLAVQLFESAAHVLSPEEYRRFALPYQQDILSRLKGIVPTILFCHNWPILEDLKAGGADVISLPSSLSLVEARRAVGSSIVLQGNLSNRLLLEGSKPEIKAAVERCIADGALNRHIFNLDHGLLPDTPFEHVRYVVDLVRAWKPQA